MLQNEPKSFAKESNTNEINENHVLRSNACVESHFRQTKKGRFSGTRKVRLGKFAQAELEFVNGKLNERLLPCIINKNDSKGLEISGIQEFWSRKRKAKFEDKSRAQKLFNVG